MGNATLQQPPVIESKPVHRNARLLLSIFLMDQAKKLQQIETWIEMAESVV